MRGREPRFFNIDSRPTNPTSANAGGGTKPPTWSLMDLADVRSQRGDAKTKRKEAAKLEFDPWLSITGCRHWKMSLRRELCTWSVKPNEAVNLRAGCRCLMNIPGVPTLQSEFEDHSSFSLDVHALPVLFPPESDTNDRPGNKLDVAIWTQFYERLGFILADQGDDDDEDFRRMAMNKMFPKARKI